jgi:hypothetical protein
MMDSGLVRIQIFILILKSNEMHYFSNLFDKVLYMFPTSPLPSSGDTSDDGQWTGPNRNIHSYNESPRDALFLKFI